jgi:two-component system, NtrC family, sensor kinase
MLMRKKIGVKLVVVVGIVAITIIGIYAYSSIQSQNEVLLKEVERHGVQLSETVKNSARREMLEYNRAHLQETITHISIDPCLKEINILNKNGRIVYSTIESKVGTILDKKQDVECVVCHAQDQPLSYLERLQKTRIYKPHPDSIRALAVINPIYNEESCWKSDCHVHTSEKKVLGILQVTLCLQEVDAQLEKSTIRAGVFAIIAIFAISIIIGVFVHRWVDRPVNYLLEATNQVASGNLNYKIDKISDDELGLLARSFNNMTRKMAEARQQLFQSDKMASLGRLAAGVAHEINNPLTGVLTYSSFLQKRSKDYPDIREDLNVIVRETLRSREIVKGLLDFARQSIPKKKKASLNEIIERSIRVVENQLNLKNITINTDFEKDIPDITVDANQIQQVYVNLLVNSSDAINKPEGKIDISTRVVSLKLFGTQPIRQATCPKNHSLIDNETKIGGLPTIKLKVSSKGSEGFIHLDPIYGKNRNQYGIIYSKNEQINLHCPECDISLVDDQQKCPECDAPVYTLLTPTQGVLEGCTRIGCHWQRWEMIDAIGSIQYIESTLSDNGCGIRESELKKIFDPFYTTKGQSGTGLGLSIIWGIVDNHSGSITVQSEFEVGTSFRIRLPVELIL